MVEYCAVPKAKLGELRAFRKTPTHALAHTHVVWDIPPGKSDGQLPTYGQWLVDACHGCRSIGVDLKEQGGFTARRWGELNRDISRRLIQPEPPLTPVLGSESELLAFLRYQLNTDCPSPILRIRRPKRRAIASQIERFADALQTQDAQAVLMLDLRAIDEENDDFLEDVAFDFCEAAQGYPWIALNVVVGAFPQSLSKIGDKSRGELVRLDWNLLSRVAVSFSQREVPLRIGDYMISHPDFASGGRGTPSIRYTSDDHWVVYMGDRKNKHDMQQFHGLANLMVRDEAYLNADFSWGDQAIQKVAHSGAGGSGNLTTWRSYGTSHHLIFASRDVAALGEKIGKGGSPPGAGEV